VMVMATPHQTEPGEQWRLREQPPQIILQLGPNRPKPLASSLAHGPLAAKAVNGLWFSNARAVRYWINFVHTAKYKIKPHAIAIDTNHIAIFPQLLTVRKVYVPFVFLSKDDHHS
jgi:hypothetical protein